MLRSSVRQTGSSSSLSSVCLFLLWVAVEQSLWTRHCAGPEGVLGCLDHSTLLQRGSGGGACDLLTLGVTVRRQLRQPGSTVWQDRLVAHSATLPTVPDRHFSVWTGFHRTGQAIRSCSSSLLEGSRKDLLPEKTSQRSLLLWNLCRC